MTVTLVSAWEGLLLPGSFFLMEEDVARCMQRSFWFAYGIDFVDVWEGHGER